MVFFEFHSSFFCVKDLCTGKILLQGPTSNGLFTLPASGTSVSASHFTPQASVGERISPSHWHQRLGHPSLSIVRHLLHRFQLPLKPVSTASGLCSACCQAKSHSLPFPRSTTVTTRPLQLLFLDVWGPAPVVSRDGFRYYLSIVDAFSRYTWLFPLQCKSDVYNTFVNFTKTVEWFFSLQISSVQFDWGGEFRSLHHFLLSQGISHRRSCPHIHQQNSVIERKHKHIVESGLTLLAHASLPKRFWIDAFKTAVYLINRLPSPVITNQFPYFLLFHKQPDYTSLRVFGSACYPHLRPYTGHKLDFRSALCVFIGYSTDHKQYLCYHIPSQRTYISRNVVFDESVFPFQGSPSVVFVPPVSTVTSLPSTIVLPAPVLTPSSHPSHSSVSAPVSSPEPACDVVAPCSEAPSSPLPFPRYPTRVRRPKQHTDGTVPWPPPRAHLTTASVVPLEPTSVTEALKYLEWRQAMEAEFQALLQTRTWTLVPSHSAQNVLGCKWIFRTKFHADGSVEQRKVLFVTKGFHQQQGLDYQETFSPVVKPSTVWLIISLAVQVGWPLHQLDVQNAFLHEDLSDDVFMAQPSGFIHPDYPSHVCKLQKALYGLKQAPLSWFSKLSSRLLELGFSASHADSSLFTYIRPSLTMYFLVYVDDIVITGSNPQAIQTLISTLSSSFPIKDLGRLHYFLGVEVTHLRSGLLLSQRNYISDLLKKTNMLLAKPVHTPMATIGTLFVHFGEAFEDPSLHYSVLGSLQYLSFTRPDLSFAMNRVCQYMHSLRVPHWQAVKRILRYLCHTIDYGLHFARSSTRVLAAYFDADWAGCLDDRRSTGGLCVFLGSHLISWNS
ncbi:Retrovirus-related Pol polyprotein from transposon TNT 1-94 [Morella rubra]|uniref:Retrovirus-related Pol polyprotein from transposon TNT 1-94 n=1 Tax=Morella rubra TaxID=262757 RepID=A0A6A1VMW6_9ROSI|nr:Retrovirus-related Pol polyprotein from transposon TNT 1-94 [Morella rubra]